MPQKNFIIYDGECGFCNKGIERFKSIIGDRIEYIPRQNLENNPYGIDLEDFNKSVKYFEYLDKKKVYLDEANPYLKYFEDARVFSAAYAVYKALANNPYFSWLLFCYKNLPLFKNFSEGVYAVIARYRHVFN